jgi:hypothetical protein
MKMENTTYTHRFTGLSAGQVSDLIDLFGDACHDWDRANGTAYVDFGSFDEAQSFIANHEFDTVVTKGFVTDGDRFLVQLPDENQFGFVLASDDVAWPGGFGSGMTSWKLVSADQVPAEDRERLEWLLDA